MNSATRGCLAALLLVFSTATSTIAQYGPFRFATGHTIVYEDAGEALIEIIRYDATFAQQVQFSAYPSSTARNFIPTNRVFTFLPGVARMQAKVQLVNDAILSPFSDYAYLTLSVDGKQSDSATLSILEDEQTVQVPASSSICFTSNGVSRCLAIMSTSESAGDFAIPLVRTGRATEALTVMYALRDGTAILGRDFLSPTGSVTFEPGQSNTYAPVTLINNTNRDSSRTFDFVLTGAAPESIFGNAGARVTITDDDIIGAPGTYAPFKLNQTLCSTAVNQFATQADGSILVRTDCSDAGYILRITPEGASLPFRKSEASPDPFFKDPAGNIYYSQGWTVLRDYTLRKLLPLAGDIDPKWSVKLDGPVTALATLADGKLFIGGGFNTVNGFPAPKVAMLNRDGTLDPSFEPLSVSAPDSIGALPEADGSVWLFGFGCKIDGILRYGGFRMLPNGAIDLAPGTLGFPYGSPRRLRDGRMTSAYSWMPDGASDMVFTRTFKSVLTDLPDGRLIFPGTPSASTAAIERRFQDGTPDPSFVSDIDASVNAAEPLPDGQLLIGGKFNTVNGRPAKFIAKLRLYEEAAPTVLLWNGYSLAALEGTNCYCVILRDGNSSQPVTVSYQTIPGTASPGIDFVPASGEITFAPGERWRSVPISILRNPAGAATNKVFSVRLSSTNDALLGISTNLSVSILDRDLAITFSEPELRVSEGASRASLSLRKTSGLAYSALLRWELLPTDSHPLPFATNRGIVLVPPGSQSASFDIPLVDDSLVQGPRTSILRLTPLSSNVRLSQEQLPITVLDNDLPGFVGDAVVGRINGFAQLTGGNVLAWGPFTAIHGQPRKGLAVLDGRTGRLAPNIQTPDDWEVVYAAVAAPDGGWLARVRRVINNTNAYLIERFSSAGSRVSPAYEPLPDSPFGFALSPDGSLYAWASSSTYNGSFFASDSTRRGRGSIIRYNTDGSRDTNFVTKLTSSGVAFFEPNGDFWLGGSFSVTDEAPPAFSSSGPVIRRYFAKFTPAGTLITNSAATFDRVITSLVRSSDGHFYAAGYFTSVNDRPSAGFARLTPEGELDTNFNPVLSSWAQYARQMGSLSLVALGDGSVLTCASDHIQAELSIYETNGAIRQSFGTRQVTLSSYSLSNPPLLLAKDYSALFIGGDILLLDGKNRPGLARLYVDGTLGSDRAFEFLGASSFPGGIRFQLEVRADRPFQIEQSSDLLHWQPSGVTPLPALGRQTLTISQPAGGNAFYRVSTFSEP